MTVGASYQSNAMNPVIAASNQNNSMRNQMSQQANERRGRELADTPKIMASSFDIISHTMTARTGMVDFTV